MSGRKQPPERPTGKNAGSSKAAANAADRDARDQLAAASLPLVLRLHGIPRWLLVVVPLTTLLLGLLLPYAWSGIFLLALAAFFGWLVALSWPRLPLGGRVSRVLVVALLVGAGVAKFLGRL